MLAAIAEQWPEAKKKHFTGNKKFTFAVFADTVRELAVSLNLQTFVFLIDHVDHLDGVLAEKLLSSNEVFNK